MENKFPILGSEPKEYIPLDIIKPHEKQALRNHGQTLKRLAERGGLGWIEALCVLEDRDYDFYTKLTEDDARLKVLKLQKDEDRVVVINIKDELGTHVLQGNSFIVKCKSCDKERHLLKSDMKDNNIRPGKCDCGGANEFRYWLDNIYTEEEYEELERQAQIRKESKLTKKL